ncbi:hypothetical protein GCM10010174_51710 [Kutzneria viridogrisea]|uniref:PH domain-containing protein n=1 Tax=Kutzneria viridogrisea TaxID=47990 RepID=A0ABR6BAW5_9PSEU|nr:hypothetical protein [Kutzneria albida]MBA8923754.1 hypothetical protein [Kutzneria viridogrisea]
MTGRTEELQHWYDLMLRRAEAAEAHRHATPPPRSLPMPTEAAIAIARHVKAMLLHYRQE